MTNSALAPIELKANQFSDHFHPLSRFLVLWSVSFSLIEMPACNGREVNLSEETKECERKQPHGWRKEGWFRVEWNVYLDIALICWAYHIMYVCELWGRSLLCHTDNDMDSYGNSNWIKDIKSQWKRGEAQQLTLNWNSNGLMGSVSRTWSRYHGYTLLFTHARWRHTWPIRTLYGRRKMYFNSISNQ